MDRTKLGSFFNLWNKDTYIGKTKGGTQLVLARQDVSDVDQIEKMSDKELINEWKGLVCAIEIYCSYSMSDIQRLCLIEMEIDSRNLNTDALSVWYQKQKYMG